MTAKPKRPIGRPPNPEPTEAIFFRLPAAEKAAAEEAAREDMRPVGQWIRVLIVAELKRRGKL